MALTGCSSTTSESPVYTVKPAVKGKPAHSPSNSRLDLLHSAYAQWEKTPYRFGGNNRNGIDCSALVQNIYQDSFNVSLPRTTSTQVLRGTQINKNNLQVADLVFFKTSHAMRHVGIYIGDNQFIHVSTSRGVMISSLDNVYWRSKYWQSRRVM